MFARVLAVLVIGFAIVVAPSACAESDASESEIGGGDCVWTSSSSKTGPSAGVNAKECVEDRAV